MARIKKEDEFYTLLKEFAALIVETSDLFMQGIDETNKSIPYIQRETYWCVF